MTPSIGDWLIRTTSDVIADPVVPSRKFTVRKPNELARCVDSLVRVSSGIPELSDLQHRLFHAMSVLDSPTISAGEIRAAVKELAENFENLLKCIAYVRYGNRKELLYGSETHLGFFSTSLGGLLLGSPDPRRAATQVDAQQVEKARIVRFMFNSSELAARVYDRARLIRNRVHDAASDTTLALLQDAQSVACAYVMACDENRDSLARFLAPFRASLEEVVRQAHHLLPFVIEPSLFEATKAHDYVAVSFSELCRRVSEPGARFSVTGDPGAGKTTFMRSLAGALAEARLANPFGDTPMPIYVEASQYAGDAPVSSLITATLHRGGVADDAADGSRVVCMDGVNEIQPRFLRQAISEIRSLATRFPEWSLVVTSRFRGAFPTAEFVDLRLAPFSDEQLHSYIHQAITQPEIADRFEADLRQLPRLLTLCRNPLLLYMLLDVSGESLRVPENRGRLLDTFMHRFLERERHALHPIEPATVRSYAGREVAAARAAAV